MKSKVYVEIDSHLLPALAQQIIRSPFPEHVKMFVKCLRSSWRTLPEDSKRYTLDRIQAHIQTCKSIGTPPIPLLEEFVKEIENA